MARETPYWLSGGGESCDLCSGAHVLEMRYHCVACDRGCCIDCFVVVSETRELLCEECRREEEASG